MYNMENNGRYIPRCAFGALLEDASRRKSRICCRWLNFSGFSAPLRRAAKGSMPCVRKRSPRYPNAFPCPRGGSTCRE